MTTPSEATPSHAGVTGRGRALVDSALAAPLDAAVDVSMMGLALGSALNLALAQGSLALLGVVLCMRALRGDEQVRGAARELGAVFTACVVCVGALAVSSLVTQAPWPGAFDATRWRGMLALPLGAWALSLRGAALAGACARVFAAGCALHACVGLWQVHTGDAPLADLLRIPPERRVIPAPGRPDLRAAGGFFYNRVRLSHVLAAGGAVSLGLAWFSPAMRNRVAWLAVAAVTLWGLAMTYGRAALGSLIVVVAGAVLLVAWGADAATRRRLVGAAAAGAAGAVAVMLASPAVRARMASAFDLSQNIDRLFLWGRGSEMALDHAPHGTGFGGYAVVRDAYYDRVMDTMQSRMMSHHLPLSLLAETGITGLLAWTWAWWLLLQRAWRMRSGEVVLGALAALTFHAATGAHDPLYQAECAVAWGFCGALMGTSTTRAPAMESAVHPSPAALPEPA